MANIYLDNPKNFEHSQTSIVLAYNCIQQAGESLSDLTVRSLVIGDGSGGFAPANYAPTAATVPWPIRGYKQEEVQPGVWKCHVTYSSVNYTFAFDLGGKEETVYQSLESFAGYPAPGCVAPDFKGAIGVDDHAVHGCHIFVPTCTWTESLEVPAIDITGRYKRTIYNLIGRTNDQPFRGLDSGEVLFRGCSGSLSTSNPLYFSLQFKFAYEPNRTVADGNPITVGPVTNVEKEGWEYLWCFFKTTRDTTANCTKREIQAVYIERVYDPGGFEDLNIGVDDSIVWGG